MRLHYVSIFLASVLLIYHQLTTWLPMYPWNDIRKYSKKELLLEAGSNGILMGTALICLLLSNGRFCYYFPLFYYPFLLIGEFFQWWLPFLSNEFAKSIMNFDYEMRFSRTIKLIPYTHGKRTPDANHIALHFLTMATVVIVYIDRLLS